MKKAGSINFLCNFFHAQRVIFQNHGKFLVIAGLDLHLRRLLFWRSKSPYSSSFAICLTFNFTSFIWGMYICDICIKLQVFVWKDGLPILEFITIYLLLCLLNL